MSESETIEYRLFKSFENDNNQEVLKLMIEAKNLLKTKKITETQYKTLKDIYS